MAIHTPNRNIRTPHVPRNVGLGSVDDIESESSGTFNVNDRSDINSETPLVLPSPGTASTASSPGISDDIWDSPPPSSHHLGFKCSNVALTPSTPQSAHSASSDSTPAPRVYKASPVKCIKEGAAKDALVNLNAGSCARTNLRIDVTQEEDYFFKPQKLIRNLTKELQAITDSNAAAAQACYNLRPDFNFGGAVKSKTSARPHRSMAATNHDARCEYKLIYKTLEFIVPMTIQARVVENQGKCVASKVGSPHERCSSNSPGHEIDIISRELSRCNVDSDPSGFIEHIDGLIGAVMCGTHRRSARSSTRQEKLKDLVTRFTHLSDAERTEFQIWVNAIALGHLPVVVPTPTLHTSPRDTKSTTSKTLKTRNEPVAPSATQSGPASGALHHANVPGFKPYQPKRTQNKSISAALREEIEKPLRSSPEEGFIYVFWDTEHFGKTKIGRTKNLERRLKQWQKCNPTHTYHPLSQRDELSKIPHVVHIERLIHIELKECRKQRYCHKCNVNHIEWFEAGEASVTKILRKWEDWIMQRPYAQDPRTGTWLLRPEMMETLDQVCEPVVLVDKQLPLRRASGEKGRRRSKRRTI